MRCNQSYHLNRTTAATDAESILFHTTACIYTFFPTCSSSKRDAFTNLCIEVCCTLLFVNLLDHMSYEINLGHRSWFRTFLLINLIANPIYVRSTDFLSDHDEQKRVFHRDFNNNQQFSISDCIPFAFGDFNADKIVDIFCRNIQGDTIRVMLNNDRTPTSKVQCNATIPYVDMSKGELLSIVSL